MRKSWDRVVEYAVDDAVMGVGVRKDLMGFVLWR
jgi:hypothetical protein